MNNEYKDLKFERECTAYHEAGHFVIGHLFSEAEFAELTDTDEENKGQTKYKRILAEIDPIILVKMLLAGPLSELEFRSKNNNFCCLEEVESNDLYVARQKLGWNPLFDSKQREQEFAERVLGYRSSVEDILKSNWSAIQFVASKILECKRIYADELDTWLLENQLTLSD